MNGVHDMGGMEGLGALEPHAATELPFHEHWEGRMAALFFALGARGHWSGDTFRHARERIPAPIYLRESYYEHWYRSLRTLLEERGVLSAAELRSGRAAGARATPALVASGVERMLRGGKPYLRDVQVAPRFAPGERVRARNLHPHGHTRLPRYVRGRPGLIVSDHGAHVFPDSSAHFNGEQPQHLYSVRFAARELWGAAAAARDTVFLDLWESYLEPA